MYIFYFKLVILVLKWLFDITFKIEMQPWSSLYEEYEVALWEKNILSTISILILIWFAQK